MKFMMGHVFWVSFEIPKSGIASSRRNKWFVTTPGLVLFGHFLRGRAFLKPFRHYFSAFFGFWSSASQQSPGEKENNSLSQRKSKGHWIFFAGFDPRFFFLSDLTGEGVSFPKEIHGRPVEALVDR